VPKFGRKIPHLRSYDSQTSFKVKRSKVRVTRPINADTHRVVRHILRVAKPTNFNLGRGLRMEDDDPHQPQAPWLQGQRSRSQGHVISMSRVGPMAHKSKTNNCSITKVGRRVRWYPMGYPRTLLPTFYTCYIAHQFQRQRPGRLTQTHKVCHIFRTVRPKNFKVSVLMEDVDPHERQAPWPPKLKIKVTKSHVMVCLTRDTTKFALDTLTKYQDAYDR